MANKRNIEEIGKPSVTNICKIYAHVHGQELKTSLIYNINSHIQQIKLNIICSNNAFKVVGSAVFECAGAS